MYNVIEKCENHEMHFCGFREGKFLWQNAPDNAVPLVEKAAWKLLKLFQENNQRKIKIKPV